MNKHIWVKRDAYISKCLKCGMLKTFHPKKKNKIHYSNGTHLADECKGVQ